MLIDPKQVIRYDRNDPELQAFFIFAICVAGKPAYTTARKVEALLDVLPPAPTPFEQIQSIDDLTLLHALLAVSMGQYGRIARALLEGSKLDLRTCTVDDLTAVPGIGPKTARYFLLYSRPDAEHAVLDTHLLKYLRANGYPDAPRATPRASDYSKWEQRLLDLARKAGKSFAEFDLDIWTQYKGLSTT